MEGVVEPEWGVLFRTCGADVFVGSVESQVDVAVTPHEARIRVRARGDSVGTEECPRPRRGVEPSRVVHVAVERDGPLSVRDEQPRGGRTRAGVRSTDPGPREGAHA